MSDSNLKAAEHVFEQLCDCLNNKGIQYQCDQSNLNAWFVAAKESISTFFDIFVIDKPQHIRLLAKLECTIPPELRGKTAIAVNKLNFAFIDGSMVFDYDSGDLFYRLPILFEDCELSENTFGYMIVSSFNTVNSISRTFSLLAEGKITTDELLKQILS